MHFTITGNSKRINLQIIIKKKEVNPFSETYYRTGRKQEWKREIYSYIYNAGTEAKKLVASITSSRKIMAPSGISLAREKTFPNKRSLSP